MKILEEKLVVNPVVERTIKELRKAHDSRFYTAMSVRIIFRLSLRQAKDLVEVVLDNKPVGGSLSALNVEVE